MLSCFQSEERDTLWLLDPDPYPFRSTLVESYVTLPLPGRTWAVAESIEAGELEAVDSSSPLPPAVVYQHSLPPRRFILLTTQVEFLILCFLFHLILHIG